MATIQIPDDLHEILQTRAAERGISVQEIIQQLAEPPPQETLDLALQTARLGVWQLDVESGLLTWNDRTCEIYGIPKGEFNGTMQAWRSQVHPDDIANIDDRFAEVFVKGQVVGVQFRILRPDGEMRYLEASGRAIYDEVGNIVRVVGINRDRTDYEHVLQQYAQIKGRYQTLFEYSLNPITVFDENAKLVMANNAAANLFGTTPDEAVARSLVDLMPDNYERALRRVQHVLDSGEPFYVQEKFGEGEQSLWYWSVFQPVTLTSNTRHVLVVSYDITEGKQSDVLRGEQVQLLAELEQERHINKMRSDMLNMLSHEFRTPLAIIRSSSDLLLSYRDHLSTENRERKLMRIQEQVDHLVELIAEITLLTKARQGAMAYEPVAVHIEDLCLDVLNALRDYAGETHNLRFQTDYTDPEAILDPKLMYHALTNIVTNAVKYSPEGGDVMLTVRQEPWQWVFSVQDSGIGIPAQEQERLFQPFSRASNVGTIDGTGIGLSIVQAIAQRHGGKVCLESEEGVGSTLTIEIPRP